MLLIDSSLPDPDLPGGAFRVHATRRRYHGRAAIYEDAIALPADLDRVRPRLFHSLRMTLPGRAPCPVAVTLHDLIPWALGGPVLAGERLRYWPAKRLLPRAELVIVPSHSAGADAARIAHVREERVRVVPEGITPVFAPREGAAGRVAAKWDLQPGYLIFIGALDFRKDPYGLIDAWRAAREEIPGVELVHAGDPGPQARGGLPGTRALGRVSDEDLADLLTAAGCLLYPSRYEGFGLPVLEAMGCGCPVAAYRNSSIPEVLGDAGILVEDGDAVALGRSAAAVLADPARHAELAAAGLRGAQGRTWRRTAAATLDAYRTALPGL